MKPEPILTGHAKDRLQSRGVSEDDIRNALRRRIGRPKPANPGKVVVLGYASRGRILQVVLPVDESVIVTAYWLDK